MTATPPPANVPPTQPAAMGDQEPQAVWPTFVGVACTVIGVLGALGACMGGVSLVMMPAVFEKMPDPNGQLKATAELMEQQLPLSLTVMVFVLIGGVLLLAGGIQCLRRRHAARKLLMIWATYKIVLVVAAVLVNLPMQQAQFEAQAASGGGAPQAMGMQFGATFGAIASVCNVIWGWALPVFILIWFSRRVVRDEVDRWPAR